MITAALDANAIVSAVLVPLGNPARVVTAAFDGRFRLVTSGPIIVEVMRALHRNRVYRKYGLAPTDIERVRHLMEEVAVVTPLRVIVQGVATHLEDDRILATAVSGDAEYLVTGDRQLLALGTYQGVAIVTPRAFLDVLRDAEAQTDTGIEKQGD